MACTHKFYGHKSHLEGFNGLLPNWKVKTLIIGTFNPELEWHSTNTADYYYGRNTNLFWDVLPRFSGLDAIDRQDINLQIKFLKLKEIGVTDLLISINDASLKDPEHVLRIKSVKDKEIEKFTDFTWNTSNIINYIKRNNIKEVYFTKLGDLKRKKAKYDSFEEQIRIIEKACADKKIINSRLHTPSGQGLGKGSPRANALMHRWYNENGANKFLFLDPAFNLKHFPITCKQEEQLTTEEYNIISASS